MLTREYVSCIILLTLGVGCGTHGIQMYPVRGGSATAENVEALPKTSAYQAGETPYLFFRFKKGSGWRGDVALIVSRSGDDRQQEVFRDNFRADEGYVEVRRVGPNLGKGMYTAELTGANGQKASCTFSVVDAPATQGSTSEASEAQPRAAKTEPSVPPGDTRAPAANAEVRAFIKVKSETHSSFTSGTAVLFKSALVEPRMEGLPVDPELFKSLAPQTQEFLRKQHGGGVIDLLLTTGTRGCGTHDAKSFTSGELTVLIPLTASNQPLAVGTKARPATVVALPTGTVSFSHPDRTQGQGSNVRVDKIDRSMGVVRGRVAIEGDLVLTADFVATRCQ